MIRIVVTTLALLLVVLFLVVAFVGWATLSRMTSGYEVNDDSVVHRTFNNVDFRVDRKEVVGADPDTFTPLSRTGGRYGVDSSSVFFQDLIITNADVHSFRVLDLRENFSRDASHVYWRSIRISDDTDHFQILSRGYSKDIDRVYYAGQVVEGADPETFVVLGTATSKAKDKHNQYDMGQIAD